MSTSGGDEQHTINPPPDPSRSRSTENRSEGTREPVLLYRALPFAETETASARSISPARSRRLIAERASTTDKASTARGFCDTSHGHHRWETSALLQSWSYFPHEPVRCCWRMRRRAQAHSSTRSRGPGCRFRAGRVLITQPRSIFRPCARQLQKSVEEQRIVPIGVIRVRT